MKKTSIFAFTTALSLAASAPAAMAEFYAGGQLGLSSPEESGFDDAVSLQIHGGYQFGDYVGVQLGYAYLGEFDADVGTVTGVGAMLGQTSSMTSGSVEIDGIELSVRGTLPISEKFSAYGRVGLYAWEAETNVKVNFNGGTHSNTVKDDDVDPMLGVGMEFAFTPRLSVHGEINAYDVHNADVYNFGAGARFYF